ncbi:isochorismate synthase MenF [uncultured Thiohalocapsa sp.]|uniref:isochorismate synthase n=1 Tax=uncultured Thiohalocapsa sp. TaxID=768990 RepID=UPI0025DEFFF9|nr:isochorismate synthase [uncultured Thiohalocapsa sp.]
MSVPLPAVDMLAPVAILEQLEARLVEAVSRLPLGAERGLQSVLLALPRAPAAAPQPAGRQFQFRHPRRGELRAGYGEAAAWPATGPERLAALSTMLASPLWRRMDPDATGFDAFAMLGFAAADAPLTDAAAAPAAGSDHLPNALLWVPEVGLVCRDHEAALVFSTALPAAPDAVLARWRAWLRQLVPALYEPPPGPRPTAHLKRTREQPDAAAWARLVEQALARIDAGPIAKVVLSRRLLVEGPRAFDVARLLDALGCLFPACQIINLRRNGRSFVAATPERLLCLRDGRLEVDAIAGTAGRGESLAADAALRSGLLGCEKNLREHRFVIDAVRAALADCCAGFHVPEQPKVLQLSNAQHLWSPISARPRSCVSLFELAARLHPTPATNGQPRSHAQAWLRQAEPFPRGWYTGAAGILHPDGDGELWVLLRCAQLDGAQAELFAGAGIVAGSDPAAEWSETEAKLAAMLSALRYA